MSILDEAGLTKIAFTYVKDGKLLTAIRIVKSEDLQKIIDLINELGE
jgi:hypothetical protein